MQTKFIGLLLAWGTEEWIAPAIEQAKYACDEVLVSIGPHSESMKKFKDNTLPIAKKLGVKLIPVTFCDNHAQTKAATMNNMLASSKYFKKDNWVWLFDVDEFYHYEDIDKIKNDLGNSKSALVESRFFYINMQKYLEASHMRLWKITSNSCKFEPTNRWTGETKPQHVVKRDVGMFHYSLLLNHKAKECFWNTEYAGKKQNNKVKWLKDIYLNYDLNQEETWVEKNKELFGHKTPFGNSDYGTNDGKLFTYEGKHPEIIEKLEYPEIKDWRSKY